MQGKDITIKSRYKDVEINTSQIIYASLNGRKTIIHMPGGKEYETYISLDKLEDVMQEDAVRISRECLVAKTAIHAVDKEGVTLLSGEKLNFTRRKKAASNEAGRFGKRDALNKLDRTNIPKTPQDYARHYAAFDSLPIAFTDIEMVFNEEHEVTDWKFRYVNDALARVEKLSREDLLSHSFRELFPCMDDKWLCTYERTALYGEVLEINDFSPEIDTYLKIICFPTFVGHCGCLIFDLTQIHLAKTSTTEADVLKMYARGEITKPEE